MFLTLCFFYLSPGQRDELDYNRFSGLRQRMQMNYNLYIEKEIFNLNNTGKLLKVYETYQENMIARAILSNPLKLGFDNNRE